MIQFKQCPTFEELLENPLQRRCHRCWVEVPLIRNGITTRYMVGVSTLLDQYRWYGLAEQDFTDTLREMREKYNAKGGKNTARVQQR